MLSERARLRIWLENKYVKKENECDYCEGFRLSSGVTGYVTTGSTALFGGAGGQTMTAHEIVSAGGVIFCPVCGMKLTEDNK